MACTLGIDIGSATSKGLILKNGSEIVESVIVTAGTGTKGPEQMMLAKSSVDGRYGGGAFSRRDVMKSLRGSRQQNIRSERKSA